MKITIRTRFILMATSVYAVLALAWIFLTDPLLLAFGNLGSILWLSTAKGVFFVVASAAMFYMALRAVPSAESGATAGMMDALAVGITPGRYPNWLMYAFAVAITLIMLLVRQKIAVPFADRPLLILFMFPIILSALLGGLGPGLLSTALAALGVSYLAIPPIYSYHIQASHDLFQWIILVINGIAVSMLSEVLRRAQVKAETSRKLLDAVISGTSDAVFVKDRQGRYLLANPAVADFLGKVPEDIIGHDDLSLFPKITAEKIVATDLATMSGGCTRTIEERVTTFDGREIVFLITKGPILDDADNVVGVFGISREITERKRAEDEIQQLNAELERKVDERTAELRAANRELEELAYALAHNLRAPLRAIGGFSQMVLDEHVDSLSEEGRRCIDQIHEAGNTMCHQVDGILALLRCIRGELKREPVDISALAHEYLDRLARAEPRHQVCYVVDPGISVVADTEMIGIVVANLLDNAWKFTRGVANASIRVYSSVIEGCSAICVSDNGAGFDMAHTGHLFRPFQRMHRHDEFPGIGIGLAIAQRIIQRHGGLICAEGRRGEGATFCFTLSKTGV